MYHFTLILLGKITEPQVNWLIEKLRINRENKLFISFQMLRTTILVFFGELFFRAEHVKRGMIMLGKMFTNFTLASFKDGTILKIGMDAKDFMIVIVFTILVFIISVLKERNVNVRESISKKNIVIRWIIYYAIIISILLFGAYGANYEPVDPMYANF